MVHVALSEQTVDKLYRVATVRGTSVSEVLERVVEWYVPDEMAWFGRPDGDRENEQLAQIEREQRAYEVQHRQLLALYPGQYVAMVSGQVIDHDPDRVALSRRVRARYGNRPVLITSVRPEARQTILTRRPRLMEATA